MFMAVLLGTDLCITDVIDSEISRINVLSRGRELSLYTSKHAYNRHRNKESSQRPERS